MPKKYTLSPITSRGKRITMEWDEERDPTQEEIDTYDSPPDFKSTNREGLPEVDAPTPNAYEMFTRSGLGSMNVQENPVEPDTYMGGVKKGLRDEYGPSVEPIKEALGGIARPQTLADFSMLLLPNTAMGGVKAVGPKRVAEHGHAYSKHLTTDAPPRQKWSSTRGAIGEGGPPPGSKAPANIREAANRAKYAENKAKLDKIKADPEFQKLSKAEKKIVMDEAMRDMSAIPPPVTPKLPIVEPPPMGTQARAASTPSNAAPMSRQESDLMGQGMFEFDSSTTNMPPQMKVSPFTQQQPRPSMQTFPGGPNSRGAVPVGPGLPSDAPRHVNVNQFELPDLFPPVSRLKRFGNMAQEVGLASREIMASTDLSAPFRQGALMTGRKEFWKALPDMFRAAGSKAGYEKVMKAIETHKDFALAENAGIAFTSVGKNANLAEEAFMTGLIKSIPIMKNSGWAYSAFLNKLRLDVFSETAGRARALFPANEYNKMIPQIAEYVNAATGRGKLPWGSERAAKLLNSAFFAPRLMAARMHTLNPATYVNPNISKFVRQEALKDMMKFAGGATTLMGLAKAAGADVEVDPRSADFGKIKVGDTRFDMLAGMGQYIRLVSQLGSYTLDKIPGIDMDHFKSANTGELQKYGETAISPTALDAFYRFTENKEAPIPSFIVGFFRGEDMTGQPFEVLPEVAKRYSPMIMQDFIEVMKTNPELLPITVPASTFGIGVQSYQPRKNDFSSKYGKKKSFFEQINPFGSSPKQPF